MVLRTVDKALNQLLEWFDTAVELSKANTNDIKRFLHDSDNEPDIWDMLEGVRGT